ncbi:FAD-dependent oxidoreductase [Nocardia sp. NPDC049707]|uniref:FAD-dependent oxidoreductase n=1 Tax=Nocardia sp. NPDC049707 TaxID=3154735 RepID=UPI0034246355
MRTASGAVSPSRGRWIISRKVVIVGAGIVGCCLARELLGYNGVHVSVLERSAPDASLGSTGYAPGFVGLYNEAPMLTELAVASAEVYDDIGCGFTRSGGLEVGTSPMSADALAQRAVGASVEGLDIEELTTRLSTCVPDGLSNDGAEAMKGSGILCIKVYFAPGNTPPRAPRTSRWRLLHGLPPQAPPSPGSLAYHLVPRYLVATMTVLLSGSTGRP